MWSTGRFSTPKLLKFHPHLRPFQDAKAFFVQSWSIVCRGIVRAQSHRFLIYLWEESHWFIVPRNVRCIGVTFRQHFSQEILKSVIHVLSHARSFLVEFYYTGFILNIDWNLFFKISFNEDASSTGYGLSGNRCKTKVHQVRRCGGQIVPGPFDAGLPRAEQYEAVEMSWQRPRYGVKPCWRSQKPQAITWHQVNQKKGSSHPRTTGFWCSPFYHCSFLTYILKK